MINCRSALRAKFTIAAIVISLFALMGCEMQDLGITESAAAPPQGEVSFSVSSQSSVPANPPAWDAKTLYNRAGLYVTHKGKVWVSQWYITRGAEPGKSSWNGWKSAETPSADEANPKPWDADVTYGAKGYYVTHKSNLWVSQWAVTRGQEPGANTWNGWKKLPKKWVQVATEGYYTLAVNNLGELYGWGWNAAGWLGDGTTAHRYTPTRIGSASDWTHISTGGNHTLAINSKGELYAWGNNDYAHLGDGSTTTRTQPARIGTESNWTQVSAGGYFSLAINSKGELYSWGTNDYGQLGNDTFGAVIGRTTPGRVGNASNWTHIAAGSEHALALNSKGELYVWGFIRRGHPLRLTPTRMGSASDWEDIQSGNGHWFARNSKGELYGFGWNNYGQVGDGSTTRRTALTRIGSASDWAYIAAGPYHSVGIKSNGELYSWGRNRYGQLGDGSTTNRSSPTKIGTAADWKSVSLGDDHSMAINAKGELYAWGYNLDSLLGDGSSTHRSRPVKIAHP